MQAIEQNTKKLSNKQKHWSTNSWHLLQSYNYELCLSVNFFYVHFIPVEKFLNRLS